MYVHYEVMLRPRIHAVQGYILSSTTYSGCKIALRMCGMEFGQQI